MLSKNVTHGSIVFFYEAPFGIAIPIRQGEFPLSKKAQTFYHWSDD